MASGAQNSGTNCVGKRPTALDTQARTVPHYSGMSSTSLKNVTFLPCTVSHLAAHFAEWHAATSHSSAWSGPSPSNLWSIRPGVARVSRCSALGWQSIGPVVCGAWYTVKPCLLRSLVNAWEAQHRVLMYCSGSVLDVWEAQHRVGRKETE